MKNILPTYCLKTIYYSHFHSHLQYGLLVWGGSARKKDITELYKIQKQCLTLISFKANRMVKILFADLYIPKITEMIRLELIKFGYTITKQQQLSLLHKMMDKRGGRKNHCYPTRFKQIPNVQRHKAKSLIGVFYVK